MHLRLIAQVVSPSKCTYVSASVQYNRCGRLSYGKVFGRFPLATPSHIAEPYCAALSVWLFKHEQQELAPLIDICTYVLGACGPFLVCASFNRRQPHDRCVDVSIRSRLLLYTSHAAAQNGKSVCVSDVLHVHVAVERWSCNHAVQELSVLLSCCLLQKRPFEQVLIIGSHACLLIFWCRCPMS